MKWVSDLYEKLVADQRVSAITRFNLRKFCRSFDLPPCGVSFWYLDDLNYDYLQVLNRELRSDKFWFRGGESFPRCFWEQANLGQEGRSEYVFLVMKERHHLPWRKFFHRYFESHLRCFGAVPQHLWNENLPGEMPRAMFRMSLIQDLIHFSKQPKNLSAMADFYLCLLMLSFLESISEATKDSIFDTFKAHFPQLRGDVMRVQTTEGLQERLDESLYFMTKLQELP
jgi:hypothetical protein